ncbi:MULTISPECIES: alpha-E domain-containing protein [unclassified Kineosporia]|uniref:alpha-E domain-containing protein n=1 Tax=unclassified Kineosporia TaxID=2626061 RepID=UPI000B4B4574|nr:MULTISPECIES: alpha-E domain-containing protein [unclassified Kineosporia]
MLSRIAESLFWIGRYVERADDTARILDVHLQLLLEDPYLSEAEACTALLAVMGVEIDTMDAGNGIDPPPPDIDRNLVLERLAYASDHPSSIVGSLSAARENARRARETVSSELWECLNMTWIGIDAARERATTAHQFFMWVRERSALVAGIADASMSQDDAWRFLTLGRSLERADMTARLVATSTISGAVPSWTTLLRSCGAYESYVRTYRGVASDERAAEFLLLDRLFPRSVLYALNQAEDCLADLAPATERVGVSDQARRLLGRARTSLEYRSLGEVLADLPAEMEKVQRACSASSEEVAKRYFPRAVTTAWIGEVS